MNTDKLTYYIIRILVFPLRFMSFQAIHYIGKCLGRLVYYFHHKFRKKTLSNLALAADLQLNNNDILCLAKKSFENLVITCLEYEKFSKVTSTKNIIICKNPELAQDLINKGQGIIFFCGHQANWEALFLDGIQRMPGIAIGRPIKNLYLYEWITSIREKFGGKIISPQNALKEGLKGLKSGKFLGIVGDQGMPESGYFHTFLGQKAWTSPAPALLSYKTKCPIIVATTTRAKGKYYITYSQPIWPNPLQSIDLDMPRIMNEILKIFEKSIKDCPEQWLWQHNRFKQETPKTVYYRYRYDCILIIFPKEKSHFQAFLPSISLFKQIYPKAFLTFCIPEEYKNLIEKNLDVIFYSNAKDLYINDYRYKFVINFSGIKSLKRHFLKQAALKVINFNDLKKDAKIHMRSDTHYTLLEIIQRAMCRPGTLWEENASKSFLY